MVSDDFTRLPGDPAHSSFGTSVDAPGGFADSSAADRVSAYAVGRIAAYLRELLDTDPVLMDCWVAGEVRSLSRSQAGHLYFTLSDEDGALRCVFFRRENEGTAVEEGAQVLAHGRISLWAERGDLQLYVDALQPEGVGALEAEFRRLLARLETAGLFDTARKRALPDFPHAVGVVTSPTGAVWHDIQTVLARRWPLTALLLAPARVQGEGAEESIVRAIEALNDTAAAGRRELDAIIVARGGGSMEDLWPFNSEAVARAIFASALPVISAVGHETDYTVSDYVADLRAPTPSAAAEMITPDRSEEDARLSARRGALGRALAARALRARLHLDTTRERLIAAQPNVVGERLRLDDLSRRATASVTRRLIGARPHLAGLRGRLAALDPAATLARGYATVEDVRGRVRASVAQLQPADEVRLRMHDGMAAARVLAVEPGTGRRTKP